MNTSRLTALLLATSLASLATAAPTAFDFKDPKGLNSARFTLDAPLEAVSGSANGISGTVEFDPADPAALTGTLQIATASLTVPNATQQGHLQSEHWLDVATYPEITFTSTAVSDVTTEGATTKATVTGDLTIKGVTRSITAPVTLTYLPGKLADRTNGQLKGDLLVLRTSFTIHRSDFGIMPGQMTDKVSETIDLSLAIAGQHAE